MFPAGAIAARCVVAWPMAMVVRHGTGALALWTMHVTDRLAAHPAAFAGEPWWEYAPGLLIQAMPWTPLAVRRGVALAPPRRRRPAARRARADRPGGGGRGRPIALGLVGRAAGACSRWRP